MSNYDENDQASIARFILQNLPGHKQFALATADENGNPWVVGINLTYDKDLRIIWLSRKDALHSQHVAKRPAVSICIFSENQTRGDFGFYATATAREVNDETEIARLIHVRFNQKDKPAPAASELQGDSPLRLYVADLQEVWINDDSHVKQPVDLAVLRSVA